MEFSTVFLLVPVLVLSLHTRTATSSLSSTGIKCYQCNSLFNEACQDTTPPNNFSRPCPENSSYCRVIEQWIDFKVVNLETKKRTIRQCGFANDTESTSTCYYKAGFGGRVNVCRCNTDNCNGSAGVGAMLTMVLVTSALSLVAMTL